MKSLGLRLLVAILAFGAGVTVATLRIFSRHSSTITAVTSIPANSKVDPSWVYLTKNIRWELPPKEIVEDLGLFHDGSGAMVVLYPDGALAIVNCNLRKSGTSQQISLNGIVQFSVYKGTWVTNSDGTITMVSRYCADPHGRDRTDNEASVERKWTIREPYANRVASLLESKDEFLIPLPANFRDMDGLEYMLRFRSDCR